MDEAQTKALITGYLELSTAELLRDIGASFHVLHEPGKWSPDITAIIGFAGPRMAGSLAFCTSHECLKNLARLGNTEMGEDWLGELSNQLLGRVKRRLAPHGAVFALSTPVVISGDRLKVSAGPQGGPAFGARLESNLGRVEIWLDAEFRDGFSLSDQPKDDGTLVEGEALLF
jgi:CheY-specific phosphatase CheX